MKLPAGPLKVIFVSRAAISENRARVAIRGAKLVPPWIVFEHTPEHEVEGKDGVKSTIPAKTECFHVHGFRSAELTPKTDYTNPRPYPWIPSTRPGHPGESLLGTHVWLETSDALFIDTKDKFNG